MRVDLPAPFSPTRAWTSPARSSKRQSRRACTPGKSLEMASISTRRPPTASATPDPPAEERGRRARATAPSLFFARSFSLLVQEWRDVGCVDVRLVVVLEARVDVLVELLALDRLERRLDALEADADRVLRDRPGLGAAADRVQLLLARVVADHDDLAGLARFLHAVQHADRGALVRAEHALEVRVRLQDGLREVGRLELVAAAVLRGDDLDVLILRLDLVGEALDPVDAGATRLVVGDDRDVAGHADERGHLVSRGGGRLDVVGRCGRERDVAVDSLVGADGRDVLRLRHLADWGSGLAVGQTEASGLSLL